MSKSKRGDRHDTKQATHTHTHTHTQDLRRKEPVLRLTGERQGGRHIVFVWGHELRLTNRLFVPLCELTRARRQSQTGYVRIDRLLISLLRRAIDEQTGLNGLGKKLIETGNYREYRLCDEAKDLVTDPNFKELPHNLINAELKEALCSGKLPDTSMKR